MNWVYASFGTLLLQNISSVLLFSVVILLTHCLIYRSKYHLPPGPWGLPFLGYMPFLRADMHKQLYSLSKNYGKIYSMTIGNKTIIVLADPWLIRDVFRKDEFSGRPLTSLYDIFDGYGIVNAEGEIWKTQRRFLHGRLRSLGMRMAGPGKAQLEAKIMNEVECLIQMLASQKEFTNSYREHIIFAVTNLFSSMVFSKRYSYSDWEWKYFLQNFSDGFKIFAQVDIANYLPFGSSLPSVKKGVKKLLENRQKLFNVFSKITEERRKTFNPADMKNDLIESFLLEEYKACTQGDTLNSHNYFERQILQTVTDLYGAGVDNIITTLTWGFVYMLNNLKVVQQMQDELDSVVGRSRLPSLDDIANMPYIEAVVTEIFRCSSQSPFGTPHAAIKDVSIMGYDIPQGTTVFPLYYACNLDPEYWEDPLKFMPERFLNEKGHFCQPKQFMAFGTGRRKCMGEILAKYVIFLFLSSILHVFHIKSPENVLPSTEGELSINLRPKPFKIQFVPREVTFSPL